MDLKDNFKSLKKLMVCFLKSEDSKISLIRDVFFALLLVLIILLAMWTYTGQWFGTPMVAIESSSMRHLNEPFGRIGTINAGDMVLLVKVNEKKDIEPFLEQKNMQYGYSGDVIVYRPDGRAGDQIIHRAMCWVEVEDINGVKSYTIEGTDVIERNASEPIYLPELGIYNGNSGVVVDWSHSGFITKGDNPETNYKCDQLGGIANQPTKVSWISGKARGEIPWVGTINLLFNDFVSGEKPTVTNVPQDSMVCLFILIAVLISIPVSMDLYSYYKSKDEEKLDKK